MTIDAKQSMTPSEVRKMYRDQLIKFDKIGLGRKTENGVKVTQVLIDATRRRLNQLTGRFKI
tara:strand:- start:175 stop:360 length:186 start_codon:yes stop_codon:yes gene_type:complete